MPHCIPCENRQVGTCYTAGLFGDLGGCDNWKGPTDCFLGKCLCRDGYCADGEVCRPQVCIAGAEPPPFRKNRWLRVFSSMSDMDPFPEYEELQQNYMDYIPQIVVVPALFLVVGTIIAIGTAAYLCCGGSGYHYSMDFSDARHDENLGLVSGKTGQPFLTDDEFAKRAWRSRPSCLPMCCSAMCIFFLCLFGVAARIHSYIRTETVILLSLERAEENAIEIANASVTINQTITDLHDALQQIPLSCKTESRAAKQVLFTFVSNALGAIDQYVDQVYSIVDIVVPVPDQISKFREFAEGQRKVFVRLPLAPLALMAVICGLIVIEALTTEICRNSAFAKCVDSGLRLAAVVFALVIFTVTILVFAETVMMIVLSKFCEDVDHNVLLYVNATTHSISAQIPELANYYIRGSEHNPVVEYDNLATKYINQIQDYYQKASIGLAGLGLACPAFFKLDVNDIAHKARAILTRARGLLAGENIYPYYTKVVRTGACDIIIAGVGWMWLLQIVVGLILFPLCAVLTHRFLVRWAAWCQIKQERKRRMAAGASGSMLGSDEDEEEEEDSESDRTPMSAGSARQMSGRFGRVWPRS
ncbi:unnamed protein product [Effrenium voratum]|nr:unnamed protein product [Effrenium voratum]CAJ1448112.1 unnamed protein product [Effrenium voratum]